MRILLLVIALLVTTGVKAQIVDKTLVSLGANSAKVDPRLFYALLVRESGKNGEPWVWTVASKDGGFYFKTKEEAIKHVNKKVGDGDTLIDIGVAQVNLHWNGYLVEGDIEKLLDPKTNILVGAKVLKNCIDRMKDIRKALSCYNTGRVTNVGLKYADDVLKVAANMGYREPGKLNKEAVNALKSVASKKNEKKEHKDQDNWSVAIL